MNNWATRLAVAILLATMLANCGIKNAVEIPPTPAPQQNGKDPAQPPHPLGSEHGSDQ
jgi:predicted small lipoprotein YifL